MKALFTLLVLSFTMAATAQVGIGTTTPNANAVLDLASPTKALIVPRLAEAAISAMDKPAEGMIVYNTSARQFWGYTALGTISTEVSQPTSTSHLGVLYTAPVGQTFSVDSAFALSEVVLYASVVSTPVLLAVSIRSGADMNGLVVAIDTLTIANTVPASTVIGFSMSGVNIDSGIYTLTVQGIGGYWGLDLSTSDPYPGGSMYLANAPVPPADLRFTIRKADLGWKQLDY